MHDIPPVLKNDLNLLHVSRPDSGSVHHQWPAPQLAALPAPARRRPGGRRPPAPACQGCQRAGTLTRAFPVALATTNPRTPGSPSGADAGYHASMWPAATVQPPATTRPPGPTTSSSHRVPGESRVDLHLHLNPPRPSPVSHRRRHAGKRVTAMGHFPPGQNRGRGPRRSRVHHPGHGHRTPAGDDRHGHGGRDTPPSQAPAQGSRPLQQRPQHRLRRTIPARLVQDQHGHVGVRHAAQPSGQRRQPGQFLPAAGAPREVTVHRGPVRRVERLPRRRHRARRGSPRSPMASSPGPAPSAWAAPGQSGPHTNQNGSTCPDRSVSGQEPAGTRARAARLRGARRPAHRKSRTCFELAQRLCSATAPA